MSLCIHFEYVYTQLCANVLGTLLVIKLLLVISQVTLVVFERIIIKDVQ